MRRKLKQAAVVVSATLVALAAAELFLRLFAAPPPTVYALDDLYLHRLVPGSAKVYRHSAQNGGGEVEVRINSLGFREREFERRPPPGTKRVIVYGDSFVEAEFTPLEETFTRKLEQGLAAAGRVEVINAGVIAYGPDQVSLRVEREAGELRPDLVVVALCSTNDFGDLLRNKIYRLGAGGELVKSDYRLDPVFRRSNEPPRSLLLRRVRQLVARLRGGRGDGPPRPLTPEAYVSHCVGRCREQYESYLVEGDSLVRELFSDQYDADISLGTDAEAARHKKRLMEGVLKHIKRTTDERGVPLLLVVIPSLIDLTDEFRIDRATYPGYDPKALTGALQEIAERNRIESVNLYDLFAANDPASLYFKFPETHWNEKGQAAAARATAERILSAGLLR